VPKYDKIEELLVELYQHRRWFSNLFDRRMTAVSEEAVLELLDETVHVQKLRTPDPHQSKAFYYCI
jgi:hypothetical protein